MYTATILARFDKDRLKLTVSSELCVDLQGRTLETESTSQRLKAYLGIATVNLARFVTGKLMALCGRRNVNDEEMLDAIFLLALNLGYDSEDVSQLLDQVMAAYETLAQDLKHRKANRASYESEGAQRSRWRKTIARVDEVVRRRRFLFPRSFELFRIFLRISLMHEIQQEQRIGGKYEEGTLQMRYVKHLVHIGLANNSALLAAALGCFLYEYSPRIMKRLYDQLAEESYEARDLSNLVAAIESQYQDIQPNGTEAQGESTAAFRQGKSSVQREIRERFRHLTSALFDAGEIRQPAQIMLGLQNREAPVLARLAELVERYQPDVLNAAADQSTRPRVAAVLNQIILHECLLEEPEFAALERRERRFLFAGYQDVRYENRRILESLFRDLIVPQASVLSDTRRRILAKSKEGERLISLLERLCPWGIVCQEEFTNHPASDLVQLDSLTDSRDEAEADVQHMLIHASCFWKFVNSHGEYKTRKKTFRIPEPTMTLPRLTFSSLADRPEPRFEGECRTC